MTRRQTLQLVLSAKPLQALAAPAAAGPSGPSLPAPTAPQSLPAFAQRGYYLTFMRMPAMGLPEWQQAIDGFAGDRINTLVLWMPGGFRSKKFPLTWQYNAGHPNVRQDFARQLIDHAHTRGIRVLLGFTPFGYDGVNRMPLEHPDWKAQKADGSPVDEFGIHSWGWSLCPSNPQARDFMREYLREMIHEFYPNADGLMVESSDYNVCQCPDCRARPYEEEFRLTQEISAELWAKNPEALILVYPHYFTGRKVPGLETAAVSQPFDPRWGLVFTPHSAHFDAGLIRQAKCSLFSGSEAVLGTPDTIASAVKSARDHGVTGYLPSLEAFSYEVTKPEGGEPWWIGRRRQPFGFDPDKEGRMPFNNLPVRLQRLAVQAYAQNPDLTQSDFTALLIQTFFADLPAPEAAQAATDLLELQRLWTFEADWYWSTPLLNPSFLKARAHRLHWLPDKFSTYQNHLTQLRRLVSRHQASPNPTAREISRLANTIAQRWNGQNIQPEDP